MNEEMIPENDLSAPPPETEPNPHPSGLTPRDHGRGKWGLVITEALHCMGANFLGGTYLAAIMLWLGISASRIALVLSFSSFAGLTMGLAPYIGPRIKRVKLFLLIGVFFQSIPLACVFFLPLLPAEVRNAGFPLIMVAYFLFCVVGNVISPAYAEVREVYAEYDGRTERYYGLNAVLSNGAAVLTFLALTVLCSTFDGEREKILYPVLGGLALFAFVLRLLLITLLVRQPIMPSVKNPGNVFRVLWEMLTSRRFRPYLIYAAFVTAAGAVSGGIDGVFYVDRMGLSLSFISLTLMVSVTGRMVIAPLWARFGERIGSTRGLGFACFLCSWSYLLNVAATPDNAVALRWAAQIIAIFGFSGTGVLAVPVQYRCMPEDKHYAFISFVAVFASMISYPVGLLVSGIIKWTDGWTFDLFGIPISEMHVLYFVAGLFFWVPAFLLFFKRGIRAPHEYNLTGGSRSGSE